jgi:predicted esterase
MKHKAVVLQRFLYSAVLLFCSGGGPFAQDLIPGQVCTIDFPDAGLPPTLFSLMNGRPTTPCLSYCLPADYDPASSYPLLLYVPGNDGSISGNIGNARTIAGERGCIAASLPLFKKRIDRREVGGGVIVSSEDYPVISNAYATMLGGLFERVPNIDPEQSAMVGFSNGALTIAVLLSMHDAFTFDHFRSFCLVDHGMFHLTDLHKARARDCRYLLLVGDQEDFGRDLKLRGARLVEDSWRLLGVDLTSRIQLNTGHAFEAHHMHLVGKWLRGEPIDETEAPRIRRGN